MTHYTTTYMRRDIFGGRTISLRRYRMVKAGYGLIDSLVTLITVWSVIAGISLASLSLVTELYA
ncbi:MAG: hypothetical protein E6Q97_08525 [Desulfurellales bacterium]|nr:MAG: hypothetical protein E6Q97_08525 [Desulfurellales bacterium]